MKSITLDMAGLDAAQVLSAIAETLPKVEWDQQWLSGSYMDGAVNAELPEGVKVATFTDPHNRVGVIIRTTIGCLVIFHRYKDGQNGVVVSNCHRNLNGISRIYGYGSSVKKESLFNTFAWLGDVNGEWYIHEGTADFLDVVDGIKSATLEVEEDTE